MALVTPDLILQPFANSGTKTAPPQTSAAGFVNFQDGYTSFYEISLAANDPNAKPVERAAQNYMFNLSTTHAQAWQGMSIAPWYASMTGGYAQNAMVVRENSSGVASVYKSLTSANINDPLSSPTTWEYQPYAYEMIANIPMPAGGANGSSGLQLTVAFDANALGNGTYEVVSDSLAASASNLPAIPGSTALAGMMEVLVWTYSNTTYTLQRYSDRGGNVFTRGATGTTFTNWDIKYGYGAAQAGRGQYVATTGSANTYAAALSPAPTALENGMEVRVRINVANTGATTFNLNGLGARSVVGQGLSALQGGELVVAGQATLRYDSAKAAWVLVGSAGGAVQTQAVTGSLQVPNLQQIQQLITAAALTDVDWTDVVNKPDVAIQNTVATFSGIEVSAASPFVDFHYGSSAADYTARLIADAPNQLSVWAAALTTAPVASFGSGQITFNASFLQTASQYMNSGGIFFGTSKTSGTSTTGQVAAITCAADGLYFSGQSGGAFTTRFVVYNNGSPAYFDKRPTFAGATPWDSSNFAPSSKVSLSASNSSSGTQLGYGGYGAINTLADGQANSLVLNNGANNAASANLAFLRSGVYGVFLGLDIDNVMKIGGWSMGAVSYPILHTGNLAQYLPSIMASLAYNEVGSYGLFRAYGGTTTAYQPILPGVAFAGSNMMYCSTGWSLGTGDARAIIPPGTWRAMSHIYNYDNNVATDSIGVFQRIA